MAKTITETLKELGRLRYEWSLWDKRDTSIPNAKVCNAREDYATALIEADEAVRAEIGRLSRALDQAIVALQLKPFYNADEFWSGDYHRVHEGAELAAYLREKQAAGDKQ